MGRVATPATVRLADYWPLFRAGSRIIRFPTLVATFRYDSALDSMCWENRSPAGALINRWYYRYSPGAGIVEWRDDFPMTGALSALYDERVVVMQPPICWGDNVAVGTTVASSPMISALRSAPPAFGSGSNIVTFEALLDDWAGYANVLQFIAVQRWKDTQVLRFWLAKGLGPICVEFPGAGAIIATGVQVA